MAAPTLQTHRPEIMGTLYTCLAQALNYPNEGFFNELTDGSFVSKLGEALKAMGLDDRAEQLRRREKEYRDTPSEPEDTLLDLQRDYTWMCYASKPRLVHLFGSAYREGKLLQESTFDIARLYYEAGLAVEETFDLPPDHIALELEFMAYLAYVEVEAAEKNEPEKVAYSQKLQEQVLKDHLGSFALKFAKAMGRSAKTPFYQVIAGILIEIFEDPAAPSEPL